RELATGATQAWQDIASATFSPTSTHLLLRRTAAPAAGGNGRGGGGGGGQGAAAGGAPNGVETDTPRGTDAILHDLASRRSQFLGSVGDASFDRKGAFLAYTVDAAVRDGNGLFVIDLATGRTNVIDNDAKAYNRMTWNDDGTGIA